MPITIIILSVNLEIPGFKVLGRQINIKCHKQSNITFFVAFFKCYIVHVTTCTKKFMKHFYEQII